jgi:aspartyl aminopeptidase
MRLFRTVLLTLFATTLTVPTFSQDDSVWGTKKSGWQLVTPAQRTEVFQLADQFKSYLDVSRSALQSNREVIRLARAAGFTEFTEAAQVKPGARLVVNNRDRALILVIIGSEPITSGTRVVATHQDSPHIDLKSRPVVNSNGMAMLKTIYYGGIKRYQWANIPLALVGRIDTSDGRTVDVSIGTKPGEPVFVIPDNAPHSDKPLRTRTYDNELTGEELNPVFATIPNERGSVVAEALRALTTTYKIKEEDLVSAELSLVPAAPPADSGIDRGLVAAAGQDDRLSSWCAARSILDVKGTPRQTAMAYLTNFEEEGSGNNTGAQSEFLYTTYARFIAAQQGAKYNDLDLRTALRNAYVISADTNDGVNPIFGSTTSEVSNAARLGWGPAIKTYGGQFDAPSELTARLRALLDRNAIPWQTQTPKVDVGGGGTIGGFLARHDMNVIDFGVPIMSMHSPYEMSSKVDVWNFYRLMAAFYLWDGK